MAHDIVRVFDRLSRTGVQAIGATGSRLVDGLVRRQYHVDTGKVVAGAITENGSAGSNTRVALIDALTMVPANVVRALGGNYEFRSVADNELGYYVLGIDLDGIYQPVCQGPVFPVAP